jgi:hypothetical protein
LGKISIFVQIFIMEKVREHLHDEAGRQLQKLAGKPYFADALMRIYAYDQAAGTGYIQELTDGMTSFARDSQGELLSLVKSVFSSLSDNIQESILLEGISVLVTGLNIGLQIEKITNFYKRFLEELAVRVTDFRPRMRLEDAIKSLWGLGFNQKQFNRFMEAMKAKSRIAEEGKEFSLDAHFEHIAYGAKNAGDILDRALLHAMYATHVTLLGEERMTTQSINNVVMKHNLYDASTEFFKRFYAPYIKGEALPLGQIQHLMSNLLKAKISVTTGDRFAREVQKEVGSKKNS